MNEVKNKSEDAESIKNDGFVRQPKPSAGSVTRKRIRGRGVSSGRGRTSGRGHKGQNARPGSSRKVGFEGGQNPLIRRLPKVGFSNMPHKKKISLVTLARLEVFFDDGATISEKDLRKNKLVKGSFDGIKVVNSKKTGSVKKVFSFEKGIAASASVRAQFKLPEPVKDDKRIKKMLKKADRKPAL